MYIAIIKDPILQEKVRRWLTGIFGTTVTRCFTLEEAQSLWLDEDRKTIRAIIIDPPSGEHLYAYYDKIFKLANRHTKIIVLNPGLQDLPAPTTERRFTFVPAVHFEVVLKTTLLPH